MLSLHDYDLSANCYAVRLFAGLLDVPLDICRMDIYPGAENEAEAFLALNPLGTVPVLRSSDGTLCDWQAILKRLSLESDVGGRWWPEADPRLVEWLAFARLLEHSAGLARLHEGIGRPADIDACRTEAHRLLRILDRHLWFGEKEGRSWLVPGGHPTVADIAVFVHVILCEEGGIERMDYPAVRRWTDRVRHLDGFTVMSGVFPV